MYWIPAAAGMTEKWKKAFYETIKLCFA